MALGCVLYEMLTGKRAFDGQDMTDTIAAVVRGRAELERASGAGGTAASGAAPLIQVVLNWQEELKQRVSTK